jgi:hypothetical protein
VGSSKKQTVGYWYEMGLHLGLCHAPVDAVTEIRSGDRTGWAGYVTGNTQIYINAPGLFGGQEREGGIQGYADVMMGGPDQVANDYLASQQGTPQPAYRGLLGLVFRRGKIAANNPYIKPWAVRVRRILAGWQGGSPWYPAKASISFGSASEVITTWVEDFATDGLAPYELVSGNLSDFELISDGIETVVQTAPTVGGSPSNSIIEREFDGGELRAFDFDFSMAELGDDDFGFLRIMDGGGIGVNFIILREAASSGGIRRPLMYVANGGLSINEVLLGDAETIDLEGEWYHASGVYSPDASTWTMRIHQGSSLLAETVVPVTAPVNATAIRIGCQGTNGRGRFGNIALQHVQTVPAIQAMNPAHIVYECLTNQEWGLGYPSGKIDEASFEAAADTFHAEGLGLCMTWSRQDAIQNFVQSVVDHAGAVCGEDPRTGLFGLKAIRADYDIGALRVFSAAAGNVISLDGFERATLTETINELTVSYTDATTGKEGSVTVQQLANIQAQGAVVPQSRSYPGLPTMDLAVRTAMRDLRAAASALARVRLTVTRDAYDLQPGDVIAFSWPELSIELMALRIGKVDYGSLTNGAIKLECVEDVFGLPAASYIDPQPIGWVEPDRTPQPAPYAEAIEVPYRELLGNLGAAETAALAQDAGFVAVVAARPSGSSLNYELHTRVSPAAYEQAGNGDWCPHGALASDVGPLATSLVLSGAVDLSSIEIGSALLVGAGAGAEICRVDAVASFSSTITVARGCCDTTPKPWPAGTRVWAFDLFGAADPTEYTDGETVNAKVLTLTSEGLLSELDAPTLSVTLASRAARPYPPGLLRIDDDAVTGAAYPTEAYGELTVTWAHRDRVLQQDQLIDENDASIGPEAGTTYTVRFYLDDVLDATQSGISGTSATPYTLSGDGVARIEVEAVRDGLTSWQAATAEFNYLTAPPDARITDAADTRITDSGDRRITD